MDTLQGQNKSLLICFNVYNYINFDLQVHK